MSIDPSLCAESVHQSRCIFHQIKELVLDSTTSNMDAAGKKQRILKKSLLYEFLIVTSHSDFDHHKFP